MWDGFVPYVIGSPMAIPNMFTVRMPEHRHSFGAPGTYFPTVRVAAHRDGDTSTPFALIQNLARARAVIH